jgi:RNA polymerase sigma-70 factor (ECF subfamily)
VLRLAYNYTHNWERARDAAQEVFTRVFRHIDQFKGGSFRAWLYTITRHTAINRIQLQDSRFNEAALPLDELIPGLPKTPSASLAHEIAEVMAQVPSSDQRTCLKLRYLDGLSYGEIAGRVGCSPKEVKSHIQNGRRQFQNRWKKPPGEQK